MAHANSSKDGSWPPESVCKIIDEIQSEPLENGFAVELYNKRGVVTKSPFEGGQQERLLAEQFRRFAEKWDIRYPRTSSILRRVAQNYKDEAKREDNDAEKRDLEY